VRFGSRIRKRCQRADAFVASTAETLAELASAGYAINRTYQLVNGAEVGAPRDMALRLSARAALAAVNGDLATDADSRVVVCIGRLTRVKGVFTLLHAWGQVIQRWPQAKLWLIGEGPDRDELFDAILDQDLRGSVMMPGTFDDVHEILQAADACVFPSLGDAPSPTALLEALAAGTPVVATDIPGHQAIVRNNEHALLVPAQDPETLASAIELVLENPPLAATRAAAGRRLIQDRFSMQRVAAEHLELFARVIEEKRENF
jgi:glycosyltransferase involved in cell wall biosynthesis